MLTHRVVYNPHIHIAKNFIALVDALLTPTPTVPYTKEIIGDEDLNVALLPPDRRLIDELAMRIEALAPKARSGRLVLVSPHAGDMLPQRGWMAERFVELTRRILAANDDALVLITGAASERAAAKNLAAQCTSDRCVAIAGHLALKELPALCRLAAVMIANDSGAAHFAAASGLPTVVLFGPETPNLYRPLGSATTLYAGLACSPCVSANNHRKSACTDNVCMRAIGVDEVFAAVTRALNAPTRRRDRDSMRLNQADR